MAEAVNQAKMKFSKIVNSRSYTRFNQNPDGESSRVEVNLSVDNEEEELDGAEQGHVQPETYIKPTSHPGSWNKWRIFVFVAVVLLIFCLGSLIGYSVHRKPKTASCTSYETKEQTSAPQVYEVYESPDSTMDWSEVVKLLNEQLSPKNIEDRISEYSGAGMAGSSKDNILADKIHDFFVKLNMDPWVDEHFVKLQYPLNKKNKVSYDSEEIGSLKGFLAYSKTGSLKGRVVYANYGELQDLIIVNENKVNINGSVVLMRAGRISMAQKVANVASKGAVAALIYPDPADYDSMTLDTELYGHVHLGSGDPYTPGFPSFNHGQFFPVKSSGLPDILAQTITANMTQKIFNKMGGIIAPTTFQGRLSNYKLGSETDPLITVEVNNELVDTKIHNVFGVIKGFVDADRYVVIGAQRDSMSSGYAKSSVGTGLLLELARVFSEMKKAGFRPKRSIVFASWTAGDYGNIGLTEWLEGYVTSLDKKAFTYISLDGVVTGEGSFKASASPLLHTLLQKTLEKVNDTVYPYGSLFLKLGSSLASVLKPMEMENGAYPFLAFSGIPSVSFRFTSTGPSSVDYKYFGTALDDKDHLGLITGQKVGVVSMAAAQVAGQIALRLVHDHVLKLDVTKYVEEIGKHVNSIVSCTNELKRTQVGKSDSLSTQWLISAKGSYSRAAFSLQNYIRNSDLEDLEMSRIINNRIMKVEHNLISPYVSLRDLPFRHVFFGNGWQTASDLETNLKDVIAGKANLDIEQTLNQFALLTWTIQGCANDLAGEIWSLDNEI